MKFGKCSAAYIWKKRVIYTHSAFTAEKHNERVSMIYMAVFSSVSNCNGEIGKDVIFGGGSIEQRSLYVSGGIQAESGKAIAGIQLNDEVTELSVDENGYFQRKLNLTSGGNYIMIQYEDFEGTVELSSEYVESRVNNKI